MRTEKEIPNRWGCYCNNCKRDKCECLCHAKEAMKKEIKGQWMVLYRHFAMNGGLITYGMAEIMGFFNSFREAKDFVKKERQKGILKPIQAIMWILRCEETHTEKAIAKTQYKEGEKD